ncbi:hypothetical protein M758_4G221000 [Ceratodon purpureus]|nr:hypothetical protein M758_4G221000 [Ceratodon purpureus]
MHILDVCIQSGGMVFIVDLLNYFIIFDDFSLVLGLSWIDLGLLEMRPTRSLLLSPPCGYAFYISWIVKSFQLPFLYRLCGRAGGLSCLTHGHSREELARKISAMPVEKLEKDLPFCMRESY